jgi:hypothetical protein
VAFANLAAVKCAAAAVRLKWGLQQLLAGGLEEQAEFSNAAQVSAA